jgi:replication-associated recombination protein RarA
MSKLEALIKDVRYERIDLSKVKDKDRLLKSLQDLNSMIGHRKIKDAIAEQTRYLIGMLDKPEVQQDFMLNTVIYGPPGIGKTTIGIHLSRIWSSLGYIKSHKPLSIPSITQVFAGNDVEKLEILTYFLIGSYVIGGIVYIAGRKIFEKYGAKYLAVYCIITLALFLAISYYVYKNLSPELKDKIPIAQSNPDPIRIVSRVDFVSEYLGQTAIKTTNLLKESIGKVLFIDEAYSLYEGHNDPYGVEALTTLNRFLSEHPREIIVIFAGYEEEMKRTIFKAQQGLSRRCMWVFKCDPYTSEELYHIFKHQVEKSGWKIKNETLVKDLFEKEYEVFKNFGGDTERLCNFAKIKHFDLKKKSYTLDFEDVEKGIERLKANHAQ